MKKKGRTITLSATSVEKIINDLSLLVVSMDRIGSTYYNKPRKQALELDNFLAEINAFKRLAQARGVLSEAYENQSSKLLVTRSEEKAEALPYWRCKKT
ncbi:MAG TPA: hypothetical protein VH413_09230 [Verrucomicrobiae bacterium]|jgi:hypothetical protein|nr:hypothetical protein [Verrucomicrobiae bacterium]